jgi:DNA-binding transcriptional regulator WhiA
MKKVAKNKKVTLAYIIGIALGDGNLSNPNGRAVRLRVSCDRKYPLLTKKIKNSIQEVFPENQVSEVIQKKCTEVSCYSNQWESILGWKAKGGSKFKQRVDVPSWIFKRNSYLISCLRGIIETDGSIYKDRGYKMVMFASIIPELASSVQRGIEQLGFGSRFYKLTKQTSKYNLKKSTLYHIRVSKDTEKFLKLLKPEKK